MHYDKPQNPTAGNAPGGENEGISMDENIRHTVLPLLTALIWGTAFVAQSVCAVHVGPFTLNAARGLIAFSLLLLLCLVRRKKPAARPKDLILGGFCCGTALFAASYFQQLGIGTTSAGKTGFITALYIVIVPVAGIFFHQKVSRRVWLAVAVAVAGMYFLCVTESFSVAPGDLYVLLCAVLFSAQILAVDHFTKSVDGFALSCAQFLVMGLLSLTGAATETGAAEGLRACLWPMLYIAVFSSCVGYTLQILAQKGGNPAVVSLLLSLESVFAVLGGAVLLRERLTGRELMGCVLMMGAIVLAELPDRKAAEAPQDGASV